MEMSDITGHAKTHKDVAHNEKFTIEALPDKKKNQGQSETDQSVSDKKVDKFPSDLTKLTEEDKKKWFREEEIPGGKILKLRTELFEQPVLEGKPIFFDKRITCERQERVIPIFSLEEDF
jgi:hypothetical protein